MGKETDILLATHNPAKLERYGKILRQVGGLRIFSLDDLGISAKAEENHHSNVENAAHKAEFYAGLSKMVTVAIDESLVTSFLPDELQPGVFARRLTRKEEFSDEQVLAFWKGKLAEYPQEDQRFIWNFAVAFHDPRSGSGSVVCVEEVSHLAGWRSGIACPGYPLSTMLSFEKGGKPYVEMSEEDKSGKDLENFSGFVEVFSDWLHS